MDVESTVLDRYSSGASERQESLCCPVDYDRSLLDLLPAEIIEKDYGCGDPSRYVREGDVVLDLGSGGGKICYMAAQLVGENGRVIGIDMNDDMLALARKFQDEMAGKLGGDRVAFLKGQIQDLALDVEATDDWLKQNPVTKSTDLALLEKWQSVQRSEKPLVADNSVGLVISNCVLNLVSDHQKQQLVSEIFRVLKPGGRVAVSDIVSDSQIPEHLKKDGDLWSGCISGAFHEEEFLQVFADAGFLAVMLDAWSDEPWQVVENIEFRSVTLTAVKPESSDCCNSGRAVIYRGPCSAITDDEGNTYHRGIRTSVSDRTWRLLTGGSYADAFIAIDGQGHREEKGSGSGSSSCC